MTYLISLRALSNTFNIFSQSYISYVSTAYTQSPRSTTLTSCAWSSSYILPIVQTWVESRNIRELQCFPGFANFFGCFIPGYWDQKVQLIALLWKHDSFIWSLEAQKEFDQLTLAFISAPMLIHPDTMWAFVVETDASSVALWEILSQKCGPPSSSVPLCLLFPCELCTCTRKLRGKHFGTLMSEETPFKLWAAITLHFIIEHPMFDVSSQWRIN